jgi:hypothetical protein
MDGRGPEEWHDNCQALIVLKFGEKEVITFQVRALSIAVAQARQVNNELFQSFILHDDLQMMKLRLSNDDAEWSCRFFLGVLIW